MKTTEVRGKGHTTEPSEHKSSPPVATESPASSDLLALIAQQSEENHELGYQLMKRIAEVMVQNLNATQRLIERTDTRAL